MALGIIGAPALLYLNPRCDMLLAEQQSFRMTDTQILGRVIKIPKTDRTLVIFVTHFLVT